MSITLEVGVKTLRSKGYNVSTVNYAKGGQNKNQHIVAKTDKGNVSCKEVFVNGRADGDEIVFKVSSLVGWTEAPRASVAKVGNNSFSVIEWVDGVSIFHFYHAQERHLSPAGIASLARCFALGTLLGVGDRSTNNLLVSPCGNKCYTIDHEYVGDCFSFNHAAWLLEYLDDTEWALFIKEFRAAVNHLFSHIRGIIKILTRYPNFLMSENTFVCKIRLAIYWLEAR